MTFRVLLLFFVFGSAHAAGFDCKKASTTIEHMICANSELSELDEVLSETYSLEVDRSDANRLRAQQKAWLSARSRCADVKCLTSRYEERLAELSCDKGSRMAGSAIGAMQCAHFQLKVLERQLIPLEESLRRRMTESSNNPDHARRVLADEEKSWRLYRDAKCAVQGEAEGGSDGWKNAFASYCAVDETKKRIKSLR